MAVNPERRNPGPSWGYSLVLFGLRVLPGWMVVFGEGVGALVALILMKQQRRASRAYLQTVLAGNVGLKSQWKHFFAFTQYLIDRLRLGHGESFPIAFAEGYGDAFWPLAKGNDPVLYGTFHLGYSDLLGFLLSDVRQHIHMVRLKVDNSSDTENLGKQFGNMSFVWVNDKENLVWAMKNALRDGNSLAMQCDRAEFSTKQEAFSFLGAKRIFPFTIYHLSSICRVPVIFAYAVRKANGEVECFHSVPFSPQGLSRKEVLLEGARHFQEVLNHVERLLKEYPYQWFNFCPMNDPLPSSGV